MQEEEARGLFRQVLRVLHSCQEKGITQGPDVENSLVDTTGDVKLRLQPGWQVHSWAEAGQVLEHSPVLGPESPSRKPRTALGGHLEPGCPSVLHGRGRTPI